jgi:hypothetical protein
MFRFITVIGWIAWGIGAGIIIGAMIEQRPYTWAEDVILLGLALWALFWFYLYWRKRT